MSTKDVPILPLNTVAASAGIVAGLIALTALVGWILGVPRLTQGIDHGPPMLLGIAVAFVLCSASLLLLLLPPRGAPRIWAWIAKGLAWAVLVLGIMVGSDRVEWRLEAHRFLVGWLPFARRPPEFDPSLRGGFTPLLFALALLLFEREGRWSRRIYVAASLLPILGALLALIGYACNHPIFYGMMGSTRSVVSLPGAVVAVLLGIALFAGRPGLEVTQMVAGRTFGGYVARWLLLTPVLIPLLNALLLGLNTRSNRFPPELVGWFFSFANILVFTVVIGLIALLLHRMDLRRRQAEEAVRRINESLEEQVLKRTDELTRTNLRLEREMEERKETERQLLRAQRVECLGALAGGVAHDLNNMLSPIQLACGLLEGSDASPESKRILGIISQSVQRGSDLVRQILTFARGTNSGRQSLDLKALLADLEATLGALLPKSIALRVRCEPGLPAIAGDPTQVYQVLMNLCINARDAMPAGGRLEIHSRLRAQSPNVPAAGPKVEVTVSDTGVGIPAEHLPSIFDPFFTTKEKGKGTGLGLATVKRIVEQHGGEIGVQSTPGAGTSVSVTFACAQTHAAGPEGQPAASLDGHGERILVVEDEEALGQILRETLEHARYRVAVVPNGVEALRSLESDPAVDLVLTDSEMPFLGGRAFLEEIQARWPNLRVVTMSGSQDLGREHEGAARRHWRLEKPFTRQSLLNLLRQAFAAA